VIVPFFLSSQQLKAMLVITPGNIQYPPAGWAESAVEEEVFHCFFNVLTT